MLTRMWSKGNTNTFMVVMKTCKVTMEIPVEVHQKFENQSTSISSYASLEDFMGSLET